MKEYKVGDKVTFRGLLWTVTKVKPGQVLLKGWGEQRWYSIEEIERNGK